MSIPLNTTEKQTLIREIADIRVEQVDLEVLMQIYVEYQHEVLFNYSIDELRKILKDLE